MNRDADRRVGCGDGMTITDVPRTRVAGVRRRPRVRRVLIARSLRDDLAKEQIIGTPDGTVPNQKADSGKEAEAFAAVTRKPHARGDRRQGLLRASARGVRGGGRPFPDEQADAALKSARRSATRSAICG